jgi:hypothetical protein
MGTGNIKWLQTEVNGTQIIIEVPYGLNRAQFKDQDFQITGCQKVVEDQVDKVVNPLQLLL